MLVDILFVVAIVIIVGILMNKAESSTVAAASPKERECPPHKWEYLEILDHRGVSTGQRMTCAVCNKTPGQMGGEE